MDRWFPVKTQRLLLRELRPSDEEHIHEYASDPLVPRYDAWGPNTAEATHEVLHRWIAQQQKWPRDDVHLGAELVQERKLIGSVRLWVTDEANRIAEIGYTFNRNYWRCGYATEAASALLKCAFRELNMHRVIAACDTRNVASWRVMEKIGMRREAYFLRDKMQKGEWRDSYLYAILTDEYTLGAATA
jgi:RimJ/RimL family protein N-acetyltransferase